jgi:TPR repeat protein
MLMRKPSLDYTTPMTPHHNQQSSLDHPGVAKHILPTATTQLGYSDALFKLGQAYERGHDGLPKDSALAFESFLRSAEMGHARAQLRVGFYYDAGLGLPSANATFAANWYRKAAEQGEPKAMFSLGLALAKGNTEFGKRPDEAAVWFERAAEKGYDRAMYNYGYCLEMGLGVEKDLERALNLYNKARDLGNTHATYRLALLEKQQ